ncbi:MAG: tRNA (adenosine(37)-N6)-dimethylallyltransferase MiaA [Mesorhizobium sp.]|nr:tRNA (adenosine(37)-N6)-dimethylallyltransferase MiaA [Mesorhizobium sp.]
MKGSGQKDRGSAPLKHAVLIAGPTASGKSALALDLARRTGGVIINADSMQVYATLSVLTARPRGAETAQAPHFLYGHVQPSQAYSTGAWFRDAAELLASGRLDGRRAIFVGGTGLYFRALLGGLSDMPEIPAAIRDRWRYKLMEEGPEKLHRLLMREDPDVAMRLRASDGQRIARALEVLETSGRSIAAWQAETGTPLVDPATAERHVIEPDRAALHARIEARFDRMVGQGALDEVAAILALRLDAALPAMKAIGVPELADAIAGRTSLEDAIARAKASTRQYAKRQSTWFRNQLGPEWRRIPAPSDAGEPAA